MAESDTPEARLRAFCDARDACDYDSDEIDYIVTHGFDADDTVASLTVSDIRAVLDRLEKLRKLDVEYGRVESAIIMADPEFDGDSPHANCGDRLIASVERLAALRGKDAP